MGQALLSLLHVAADLSVVDLLSLVGEIRLGLAPRFRLGAIVDSKALEQRVSDFVASQQSPPA